ncbi:MAG: 50S ribosomal protein L30 [Nanoarchaeota archaeon]
MADTKKEKLLSENKLLAVIRISGMVDVKKDIAGTLDRLRLRRKYACILITRNKNNEGMLKKVKFYIAYGEIDKNILVKLIKERAKSVEGDKNKIKINVEEVADNLIKGKKLSDFELKPFFRLHPPRKGIKSKLVYPKGVLGNNGKDINKLIERML